MQWTKSIRRYAVFRNLFFNSHFKSSFSQIFNHVIDSLFIFFIRIEFWREITLAVRIFPAPGVNRRSSLMLMMGNKIQEGYTYKCLYYNFHNPLVASFNQNNFLSRRNNRELEEVIFRWKVLVSMQFPTLTRSKEQYTITMNGMDHQNNNFSKKTSTVRLSVYHDVI